MKEGAFCILEYKSDNIKEILFIAAGVVNTIANVVSGCARIVKNFTGKIGIVANALNEILQTRTGNTDIRRPPADQT